MRTLRTSRVTSSRRSAARRCRRARGRPHHSQLYRPPMSALNRRSYFRRHRCVRQLYLGRSRAALQTRGSRAPRTQDRSVGGYADKAARRAAQSARVSSSARFRPAQGRARVWFECATRTAPCVRHVAEAFDELGLPAGGLRRRPGRVAGGPDYYPVRASVRRFSSGSAMRLAAKATAAQLGYCASRSPPRAFRAAGRDCRAPAAELTGVVTARAASARPTCWRCCAAAVGTGGVCGNSRPGGPHPAGRHEALQDPLAARGRGDRRGCGAGGSWPTVRVLRRDAVPHVDAASPGHPSEGTTRRTLIADVAR